MYKNIINEINSTNNVSELSALKMFIDEAIDKHMKNMIIKEKASKLACSSLGVIKETFENMSPELFKTTEGRKLIGSYKNIVKENKSLSTALMIFENFRKSLNESTVQYLFNDIEKYTEKVDVKQLHEGINELGDVLYSSYMLLGEDADIHIANENKTYDNAVMYIIENKKKLSNSVNFANANSVITEHVKKQVVNTINDEYNKLIESISNAFNGYFDNENVNDVKIDEYKTKEMAFEAYKHECMTKINEVITSMENTENVNEEELNKIKTIYEQVSKKEYSKETINSDITNLIGITKCFE